MKYFVSLCILSLFIFSSFNSEPKIIVIDAGHGAQDKGAVVDKVLEKEISLAVAKQIEKLQNNPNFKIILTRSDDSYPSLTDRVGVVNNLKPDLVISLHANYNPKNKEQKGGEIFYQNSEKSKTYAQTLAKSFNDCKISEKNLHLLTHSTAPALLLEMGFLSNNEDRIYLNSEKGQKETAQKILDFIYGIN